MTDLITPMIDDPMDDTFASAPLVTGAPKLLFPQDEHEPREIYQLVRDELMLDGVARMNLATFCTTWVEPEVNRPGFRAVFFLVKGFAHAQETPLGGS